MISSAIDLVLLAALAGTSAAVLLMYRRLQRFDVLQSAAAVEFREAATALDRARLALSAFQADGGEMAVTLASHLNEARLVLNDIDARSVADLGPAPDLSAPADRADAPAAPPAPTPAAADANAVAVALTPLPAPAPVPPRTVPPVRRPEPSAVPVEGPVKPTLHRAGQDWRPTPADRIRALPPSRPAAAPAPRPRALPDAAGEAAFARRAVTWTDLARAARAI